MVTVLVHLMCVAALVSRFPLVIREQDMRGMGRETQRGEMRNTEVEGQEQSNEEGERREGMKGQRKCRRETISRKSKRKGELREMMMNGESE